MGNYTYVNGDGVYNGNILLEPDGNPTRAEMYDAIAEVCRPVEITVSVPAWVSGLAFVLVVAVCVTAVCNLIRVAKGLL